MCASNTYPASYQVNEYSQATRREDTFGSTQRPVRWSTVCRVLHARQQDRLIHYPRSHQLLEEKYHEEKQHDRGRAPPTAHRDHRSLGP